MGSIAHRIVEVMRRKTAAQKPMATAPLPLRVVESSCFDRVDRVIITLQSNNRGGSFGHNPCR